MSFDHIIGGMAKIDGVLQGSKQGAKKGYKMVLNYLSHEGVVPKTQACTTPNRRTLLLNDGNIIPTSTNVKHSSINIPCAQACKLLGIEGNPNK